jgi:predicted dehydrogenase
VLRLGIIGLGWVARDYALPAIEACKGLKLEATADPAEQEGRWHAPLHFSDHRQMLSEAALDAVYVASPNHLHPEHTIDALNAACHVLCEKPLTIGSRDAEEMAELAARRNLVLQTAFDQRYHPAHIAMKALIEKGAIGRPVQIRIDYACWVDEGFLPDNWRIEEGRAGGGAVIDLAPHGLDLTEWLSGDRLSSLQLLRQSCLHAYAVDDGGVLIGRTRGGVLLSQSVGYNRPEGLPRRRLEVIGSEGALLAENTMGQTPGGTLALITPDGERRLVPFDDTPPFHAQFGAFLEACRSGRATRCAEEDARLVRLLEDAFAGDTAWR